VKSLHGENGGCWEYLNGTKINCFLLDFSVSNGINLISNIFFSPFSKWIISRYCLSVYSVTFRYSCWLGLYPYSYAVTGVWICTLDCHTCANTQTDNRLPCMESLSRSFTFNCQSHGSFSLWLSARDSNDANTEIIVCLSIRPFLINPTQSLKYQEKIYQSGQIRAHIFHLVGIVL